MAPQTFSTARPPRVPSDMPQLNIRLDPETREKLLALQDRYGLSQAGVVKMLIRDRVQELLRAGDPGFTGKRKLGGRSGR